MSAASKPSLDEQELHRAFEVAAGQVLGPGAIPGFDRVSDRGVGVVVGEQARGVEAILVQGGADAPDPDVLHELDQLRVAGRLDQGEMEGAVGLEVLGGERPARSSSAIAARISFIGSLSARSAAIRAAPGSTTSRVS